ncbi:PD-(D/E)XK nuclease family protein [Pseudoflavitalea sp. G-6-1-2]|uniref:PD-(D/E)XK nuclease family protein n=1 Tax=Pseudoflavitalea sp. G-6-1-2 TaxID=2728841 RepID=UPI00146B6910|nr:PD-(D/E)XK nuclease family protein [Pseudoflavitalea sp. G-6-1-2]NML23741.1 PD-(D/E)XK nuclease family protein [Pseudoflavitalea sp. G-6-1-2]
MESATLQLDWILQLIASLPETKKIRKTIFDIAGFPRWENVNSNTLAFYLDENEEHGFGRLFFDSLLEILIAKGAIEKRDQERYEINYTIERETYADSKRIDIVLRSAESKDSNKLWAIIIENKIDAKLYNDLEAYWKSIHAENKTGVVISLHDNQNVLQEFEKNKGIKFTNILHDELIKVVLGKLSEYYLFSDDRHLLMLKDYFQNISNMTQQTDHELLQTQWEIYKKYANEIEKLKKVEQELKDYTAKCLYEGVKTFGFDPATIYAAKGKHFYATDTFVKETGLVYLKYFRFYFAYENLVSNSAISIYYELHGEFVSKGKDVVDGLKKRMKKKEFSLSEDFSVNESGSASSAFFHLITCNKFKFKGADPLQEQVTQLMKRVFFNDQFNIVLQCADVLREALNEPSLVKEALQQQTIT